MIEIIITSVLAFIATNIDDVFIIMLLFSAMSRTMTRRDIYQGQYLGMIVLIILSVTGSFSKLLLSPTYIGLLGLFPIYIGIREWIEVFQDEDEKPEEVISVEPSTSFNKNLLSKGMLSVASVTIANGGDNVGIYIPLFATQEIPALIITISIFLILVYPLLKFSEYVAAHPTIVKYMNRRSAIIFPAVLIALGVYIMIKSGTFVLLNQLT
jgi:cadmium resistance transport/sequestration family protein